MATLNEMPTEVLEKMAQGVGTDLTRVEPEDQDAVKQSEPLSLDAAVAKMEKENGKLGRFNQLVKQRMNYHKTMKELEKQKHDDELGKRAQANRTMLHGMFGIR